MIGSVGAAAWFAAGYALFLLVAAYGVDAIARRTAGRAGAWRAGGFRYRDDHDAWVCPQDQWLWPTSFDPENRVMRYRADPLVCNACPVKSTCTTGRHGREVSRNVDPWPSSEAERFHRGIACAVTVLAAAWPLVTIATVDTALERGLLGAVTLLVVLAGAPLWSHLRRSPPGFPEHVALQSLDETVLGREARTRREDARRASYSSDRRETIEAPEGRRHHRVEQTWQAADEGGPLPGGWSRVGPS